MSEEKFGTAQARIVTSIHDIDADFWNRCAGDSNPFIGHAFLSSLEDSGSVGAEEGWKPAHVVIESRDSKPLGVAPAYIKSHSSGEFVFDYAIANALERIGENYYPKYLIAVPFTPVSGSRLLVSPDCDDAEAVRRDLIRGIVQFGDSQELSSVHVNFALQDEWNLMGELGLLKRCDIQYRWSNNGYENFTDFLNSLSSRKRKAIRKERREATANGITVHRIRGDEMSADALETFYACHRDTFMRFWGAPYLTRKFFDIALARMGHRILFVMCRRADRWIAGAMNVIGSDTLYGRYWGSIENHRMLHFECCYYQSIEYAIENGLAFVEAGAQGHHKIQRGYLPKETYSAHWFRNPRLSAAVRKYFREEARDVSQTTDLIERLYTPFREARTATDTS